MAADDVDVCVLFGEEVMDMHADKISAKPVLGTVMVLVGGTVDGRTAATSEQMQLTGFHLGIFKAMESQIPPAKHDGRFSAPPGRPLYGSVVSRRYEGLQEGPLPTFISTTLNQILRLSVPIPRRSRQLDTLAMRTNAAPSGWTAAGRRRPTRTATHCIEISARLTPTSHCLMTTNADSKTGGHRRQLWDDRLVISTCTTDDGGTADAASSDADKSVKTPGSACDAEDVEIETTVMYTDNFGDQECAVEVTYTITCQWDADGEFGRVRGATVAAPDSARRGDTVGELPQVHR